MRAERWGISGMIRLSAYCLEFGHVGDVFERRSFAETAQIVREGFAEVLDDRQVRRPHRDETLRNVQERIVADQAAHDGITRGQRPDQKRDDVRAVKAGTPGQTGTAEGRGAPRKRVEQRERGILPPRCETVHLLDPLRSARATSPTRMGNGGTSLSHSVGCATSRTTGGNNRRASQDSV